MNQYAHLSIASLLLLFSCSNDSVKSSYSELEAKYQESADLEIRGHLTLKLDSVTGTHSSSIQYLDSLDREYLAFWNSNDLSIQTFDLQTGLVVTKQYFSRNGPNANYSSNFLIVSQDSIFMSDAIRNTYLVNAKSDIIAKYPVEDSKELERPPGPYIWTGSPMTYCSGNLYFQGYIGGIFNQPNMTRLNLPSSSIDYFGGYPEFYRQAYWRGGFEYMYLTFNPNTEQFVCSFAADQFVRVTSIADLNETKAYFASSTEYQELYPPRLKMSDPGFEHDERKFKEQASFGQILFDKYRNLYYRFGFDPISDTDITSEDTNRSSIKKPRIIILNASFDKVGEVPLERFKYDLNMTFVSKQGLCLKLKNEEVEDYIEYDILAPKKVN